MDRSWLYTVPDVADAVARDLADAIADAAAARGRVVLCAAGGSTPMPAYRRLAERRDLPWGRVWVAFGDERDVAVDDRQRNEANVRQALLDHVPVPEEQVVPWPRVEHADPADVAEAYALRLRRALGDPSEAPWFDVTLLGLGEDAHTAGLFPGVGATRAPGWATSLTRDGEPFARLTLTLRALNASRRIWFLVQGEAKREALERTLAAGDEAAEARASGDGAAGDGAAGNAADVLDALPATGIVAHEDVRIYTDLEL